LAVIRLSGDSVHELFASVIVEKDKFATELPRKIALYTVIACDNARRSGNLPPVSCAGSEIIDEVTAIKYTAPRSFTGEDMVEIFCHGGSVIPQKILDRLFRQGAQPAGRGEFSRRAFLNGKMDLLKAESITGLIDSQTEKHFKSAQLAYQGKQLELLEGLKRRIINILSDIESRIEFGEDDDVAESVGGGAVSANVRDLGLIVEELEEELRRGERVRSLDDGLIVALAGPPNAGKSSLFNEILGYDRSIVHDRPGTTRDIVSERILFEGIGASVKLFDSAGIRETDDAVEQAGIERAMEAVGDAHFVIWVTSADEVLGDNERRAVLGVVGNLLIVINKIDIATSNPGEKKRFCQEYSLKYVETSLTEKINTDKLFDAISTALRDIVDSVPAPEIAINARHRGITALIVQDLRDAIENFDREEVAAHYLKSSLDQLAEFFGYVAGDEVLDGVFEKFCIGK
jgi:tRNA modification GTPase